VLRHSRRKLCARIEHLGEPSVPLRKIQRQEVIVSTQYKSFLVTLAGIGYWALLLTLVGVFIAVVMSFFPRTVSYATSLSDWLLSPLKDFGGGIAAYLPNLFFVAVICFVTYFVLKLSTFIFTAIQDGKISIEGFYPDWAGPTSHLVRILVYLLVVIITYPYLPGSKSPVFQGISVFLGFLLSLGSSSVVANTVAGTILTYMRPFRQGDRVTIGETQGVIVEKSLLVTRVRTPKNVVVTIPNGSVMGSQIINFSTLAQEEGLILHTTVTIGYDAPWRKVHELLINAALTTEHILKEPAPFVLQTSLDDFYITYEINAYTDDTRIEIMEITYSTLHQNIQDAFNAAGVEIMSPHYTSLRDGNETTIPGHRGGSNETSQMIQLFPNKRVKP
jgi:small-conductance mechanosensitive channel